MAQLWIAAGLGLGGVCARADTIPVPLPPQLKKDAPAKPVKRTVWSIGVAGERHSLKAGDGNELLGNAAEVQLGSGYLSQSWYLLGTLDILLGPYEPTRDRQLNVDYVGTGLTIWTGFSAQTMDLRSSEGGYGFALGLSYADMVGRAVGRNRKDSGERQADGQPLEEDKGLIDTYAMRITNFSLLPAIFFSWLDPARPQGNSPELLATRVEGYLLTLGVAMPLQVSYQAKYETFDGESHTETGQLRGYSIMASLTALLGT